MWAIRMLSGPQAGQIFQLKSGRNVLGRAPSCDIKVLSPNVSKEHVQIDVLEDKFIVTDMGSRNGTYVNGTQCRSSKIRPGDKVGLHDVIFEIVPYAAAQQQYLRPAVGAPTAAPHYQPLTLAQQPPMMAPADAIMQGSSVPSPGPKENNLAAYAKDYMDRVVLPGVYRVAEIMEFKTLLGLFMAGFILLVTSLSTIPLIRILRDSVESQSQQMALTVATTLARVNEAAVRDGLFTAINMSTAQRPGVTEALIITKVEGKIIAPASRAESYPDLPFIHEARNFDREAVKQIDGNTVVALYPIISYNPDTGSRGAIAFAVVKYDMASLAVDDGQTISLFVITLFIASLIGGVLFYFLYKLMEHPIHSINLQLDSALREGRDDIKTTFLFEPLQQLTSKVNSALSRALSGGSGGDVMGGRAIEHDRRLEMTNLVEMIGFPAIIISAHDRTLASMNQGFEQKTRLDPAQFLNQSVTLIADQALRQNIIDIIDRLDQNPDQLVNNTLDLGGNDVQVIGQAIFGTSKVAYYLIIIVPGGGEG